MTSHSNVTSSNDFLDDLRVTKQSERSPWEQVWTETTTEDRSAKKLITFMRMCKDLSTLSHDQKVKVATIIVTDNFGEICSIGYNGDYSGGPNLRVDMAHGQSNFLHSEENALFRLGKPYELRDRLILMCTHKPCTMCAKRIVNSGIKRVIYDAEYCDSIAQTDEIFSVSRVNCQSMVALLSSKETLETYLDYAVRKDT